MPKTDTSEHPTTARPPRPEPRATSEARAPDARGAALSGARSEYRLAPNANPEGWVGDVVQAAPAAELGATVEEPQPAEIGRGSGALESPRHEGPPQLAGLPLGGLPLGGLPLANLEGPSMASLDLTPSPVPRVSLAHATGSVDISLVPGPHVIGSRNLPTLAARHALGPPRARAAAPAISLFPERESLGKQPSSSGDRPLARKLKTEVRSSKREIVLGLSIGVGLSVVLAGLGQSYLESQSRWRAQGEIETATLSALPRPASVASAVGAKLPEAKLPEAPAAAAPAAAKPPAAAQASSDGLNASPGASSAEARETVLDEPLVRGRSAVAAPPAPRRRSRLAAREMPRRAPRRAASDRAKEASSREVVDLPEKTPLSPSESAGLGLDLPL